MLAIQKHSCHFHDVGDSLLLFGEALYCHFEVVYRVRLRGSFLCTVCLWVGAPIANKLQRSLNLQRKRPNSNESEKEKYSVVRNN